MWRFLKKLELALPYDPAIPMLGIHTEETRIERDTCVFLNCGLLRVYAQVVGMWDQKVVLFLVC